MNLGDKVYESKIIEKNLRTLPERFHLKVTAIEIVKHLDKLKVKELVGALETYEMTFLINSSSAKSYSKATSMVLKTTKEEDTNSSSSDSDEDPSME